MSEVVVARGNRTFYNVTSRGYSALPVLAGTEIVGHVDPKADRTARKLVVVSRQIRRGHVVAPATRAFARWLGLR